MVRVAAVCAALAGSCALPAAANTFAEGVFAEAREIGARRVDLTGRQRMLSQRVAKSACLAARGADRDASLDELRAKDIRLIYYTTGARQCRPTEWQDTPPLIRFYGFDEPIEGVGCTE